MRFFTTIAAFGLVALATAQTSTNETAPATSTARSASAPATTSEAAQTRCLNACDKADICCKAACVGVPCPNDLQANQTTECAAQCHQGNGSEEETSSYASCQQGCISSMFFPLSTTAGGAAASGTGAGSSGATTSGASGTGIGAASQTGSGASASATDGSSSDSGAMRTKVAGAGLLGLVLVGLAL